MIKRIGKQKRIGSPGEKWKYSDSNYSILAYIAEKVSGQPLEEYIKQHVFATAGMKHSGFGRELEQTRFPSTGYKIVNNNMTTPNIPSMSQLYGCGDIYTSAHDLYLFNEALFSGKLISKKATIKCLQVEKRLRVWMVRRPGKLFESRCNARLELFKWI